MEKLFRKYNKESKEDYSYSLKLKEPITEIYLSKNPFDRFKQLIRYNLNIDIFEDKFLINEFINLLSSNELRQNFYNPGLNNLNSFIEVTSDFIFENLSKDEINQILLDYFFIIKPKRLSIYFENIINFFHITKYKEIYSTKIDYKLFNHILVSLDNFFYDKEKLVEFFYYEININTILGLNNLFCTMGDFRNFFIGHPISEYSMDFNKKEFINILKNNISSLENSEEVSKIIIFNPIFDNSILNAHILTFSFSTFISFLINSPYTLISFINFRYEQDMLMIDNTIRNIIYDELLFKNYFIDRPILVPDKFNPKIIKSNTMLIYYFTLMKKEIENILNNSESKINILIMEHLMNKELNEKSDNPKLIDLIMKFEYKQL